MLLCASCNRAKSWSCEHCANNDPKVCLSCYWASPLNYTHIALRGIRRVELVFTEDEPEWFQQLKSLAEKQNIDLPDYIKNILQHFTADD